MLFDDKMSHSSNGQKNVACDRERERERALTQVDLLINGSKGME